MSELLREACAEARKENIAIRQLARDIGKLVSNVEVSVEEAVYIVL